MCKGLVKDILTCALTEEWVSNACVSTPVCLPKYQSTFEDCKGSGLVYEDALPASATDMGYPAYASAAVRRPARMARGHG